MRTTLELPDPLFARLKARASSERHAQLLRLETFGTHPAATGGALGHLERTPQQRGTV